MGTFLKGRKYEILDIFIFHGAENIFCLEFLFQSTGELANLKIYLVQLLVHMGSCEFSNDHRLTKSESMCILIVNFVCMELRPLPLVPIRYLFESSFMNFYWEMRISTALMKGVFNVWASVPYKVRKHTNNA